MYSVKRHTSSSNAYEYVDPPPQLHISNERQFTSSNSDDNVIEYEKSEEVFYRAYLYKIILLIIFNYL